MARSAPPTPASSTDDLSTVLSIVRGVVEEVSDGRGLGRIAPDVSFERELGLGSLERVELAVRVGEALDVQLGEDAIATADTPAQLLAAADRLRGTTSARPQPVSAANKRALLPTEAPAAVPIHAATLVEVLEAHMQSQPDRVHIVLEDDEGRPTPITYRALHQAAMAVARGLRARGLAPGRCVAIMLPTELGYFASFLGVLLAGGIPVPLYPPVRLDRITEYMARCETILDNAQAQVLITFSRAARVAEIARDRVASVEHVVGVDALMNEQPGSETLATRAIVSAADTALLQYTSGSTGDPKGVELTHANVVANIRASVAGCELGPDDVMVSWLPLYHDMGLIGGWLMCFYYGVPTVLMSPMAFLSRPQRWLQALSDYGGTVSVAPNFAFDLCVKRVPDDVLPGLDLGPMRALLNGSEPITVQTLDRFVERFGPAGMRREAIFCAYGLAENMVAVAFPPVLRAPRVDRIDRTTFESSGRAVPAPDADDALEFVCVGSAVPLHEIQVVDALERPVGDRVQGTIQFRGPSSFKGYYRRPEATAKVQRPGGWVDTGDLGYLADGELFITGRVKDLIIKGGRNYYPHEFEAAAATVQGVRQGCVAAFAVPDASTGTESIVVVAETRETDDTAREQLQGRIVEAITAAVGIPPDRVVLGIPGAVLKTSSGKIRRRETKQLFTEGTLNDPRRSVARQTARLFAKSLPKRASMAAKKAGELAYGVYAATTIGSVGAAAPVLGRLVPSGKASRRLAATEAKLAMRLSGLKPRVTGLEHIPSGAALLVANHSGYLDFLICTAALPKDIRFVIKGEMRDNPVVGPILEKMGHVFIDRHSTARSLSDLDEVVQLLRDGERVVVFPEGTFNAEVGMRSFKLGAFQLAARTQTPIVPIAIRGSRRALRDGTWLPKPRAIEVELMPSMRPTGDGLADVVSLRDQCADAIASKIDEPRLFAADITVPGG
ncbi:MAG: AMP-binding protein [Myxococcota bacterium]